MSKIQILSKTGRDGGYTFANEKPLMDNRIYYKKSLNGNYEVFARWGYRGYIKNGVMPEKTHIVINSMSQTAKSLIKDSLGISHNVKWVEVDRFPAHYEI